ncbi:MAG: carboxypeptidase-like regulatory domain-containing protein [Candidatus Electrothrix aestuarii]|uniref:Carboxypeptidase-like regulatory domain-containing protein n=1 Tax=Candidatus Electrothrix aestuarii TaxID=3062594 RepID=A0AAU8LP05_9BACT|nr:carboxypeptidase-like regulatory domain-containing protein [Candidatus Electrothrix aestuarii]
MITLKTVPTVFAFFTLLALLPISSLSAEPQESNLTAFTTGSIAGKVTDEAGTGIDQIYVTLYSSSSSVTILQTVKTGSDGSYVLSDLAEGSYKIQFHGIRYQTVYLEEWYNDKSGFDTAEAVTVTASSLAVTNIDAELALGGSITGRVTDEAGNGIADVSIYAYNSSSWITTYKGHVHTESDGSYTIPGLPNGSYKLSFDGSNYANEWYPNSCTFAQAYAVAVTAPQTTSNIDAVLSAGGNIAGRVTDKEGKGIEGIDVAAVEAVTGDWGGSVRTDSEGYYTLSHLFTGTYRIEFSAGRVNAETGTNYIGTYYNDKKGFFISDPVSVVAPETSSNINAVLGVGGSISGRVTDSEGQGISSVDVSVYDSSSYSRYGAIVERSGTDTEGNYMVRGVPTGPHKVQFNTYIKNFDNDNNYANAWYSGGRSFADADIVQVTAPDTVTSGVDAVLTDGGSVSGTVTDKFGHGIADIFVYAYADGSSPLGYGFTDLDGKYTIPGLPEGSYAILFDSFTRNVIGGDRCIDEWYSDKIDFFHADSVTVIAPKITTSGIDAVLQRTGNALVPILQLLLL